MLKNNIQHSLHNLILIFSCINICHENNIFNNIILFFIFHIRCYNSNIHIIYNADIVRESIYLPQLLDGGTGCSEQKQGYDNEWRRLRQWRHYAVRRTRFVSWRCCSSFPMASQERKMLVRMEGEGKFDNESFGGRWRGQESSYNRFFFLQILARKKDRRSFQSR